MSSIDTLPLDVLQRVYKIVLEDSKVEGRFPPLSKHDPLVKGLMEAMDTSVEVKITNPHKGVRRLDYMTTEGALCEYSCFLGGPEKRYEGKVYMLVKGKPVRIAMDKLDCLNYSQSSVGETKTYLQVDRFVTGTDNFRCETKILSVDHKTKAVKQESRPKMRERMENWCNFCVGDRLLVVDAINKDWIYEYIQGERVCIQTIPKMPVGVDNVKVSVLGVNVFFWFSLEDTKIHRFQGIVWNTAKNTWKDILVASDLGRVPKELDVFITTMRKKKDLIIWQTYGIDDYDSSFLVMKVVELDDKWLGEFTQLMTMDKDVYYACYTGRDSYWVVTEFLKHKITF